MKLLFVISDASSVVMGYRCDMINIGHGVVPRIRRRTVTIELTDSQMDSLKIRQLATDCERPIMEDIESISIELPEALDDKETVSPRE